MKDSHTLIRQQHHALTSRRVEVRWLALGALAAMVWFNLAFCSEIHDAAANGDVVKVTALLKDNPDLVSISTE